MDPKRKERIWKLKVKALKFSMIVQIVLVYGLIFLIVGGIVFLCIAVLINLFR